MNRRKRRPNYFGWVIFILVVGFGYYFNTIIVPESNITFGDTPTATRSAESFVTEAKALFEKGKLSQAIDAYNEAIRSSPQDPTLYIAIARVQVFAGHPEDAQSNAENAMLLSPNNSMAYAVHAWALDFQDGKNGEAVKSIEDALRFDPNNAYAHAYYAEILIDTGLFDNYEKAAEESRVAIALDPNILETHRARGYVLNHIGTTDNYEAAIKEYEEAVKINPNISLLHIELGQNYRSLQVYDQAITQFTLADTLNPGDPLPDLYISRIYVTTGEYPRAQQYAETAVKDRPDDPSLHGNLGVIYYYNFLWPETIEQLGYTIYGGKTKDGVEIKAMPLINDVLVAEYYYTYGLALAHTGQCGEAITIAQMIQSRVPSNERAMSAADEINKICTQNLNN